jgi:hypothetical protein
MRCPVCGLEQNNPLNACPCCDSSHIEPTLSLADLLQTSEGIEEMRKAADWLTITEQLRHAEILTFVMLGIACMVAGVILSQRSFVVGVVLLLFTAWVAYVRWTCRAAPNPAVLWIDSYTQLIISSLWLYLFSWVQTGHKHPLHPMLQLGIIIYFLVAMILMLRQYALTHLRYQTVLEQPPADATIQQLQTFIAPMVSESIFSPGDLLEFFASSIYLRSEKSYALMPATWRARCAGGYLLLVCCVEYQRGFHRSPFTNVFLISLDEFTIIEKGPVFMRDERKMLVSFEKFKLKGTISPEQLARYHRWKAEESSVS